MTPDVELILRLALRQCVPVLSYKVNVNVSDLCLRGRYDECLMAHGMRK